MKICALFDKYRDGELGRVERENFHAHLEGCPNCQGKLVLLNNLALVLKKDPVVMTDLSEEGVSTGHDLGCDPGRLAPSRACLCRPLALVFAIFHPVDRSELQTNECFFRV